MRRRILACPRFEGRPLVAAERNDEWASSRHQIGSAANRSVPSPAGRVQDKYVIVIMKRGTKSEAEGTRGRTADGSRELEGGRVPLPAAVYHYKPVAGIQ